MAGKYLDKDGLLYFWNSFKGEFGATLSISGQALALKNKSGTQLSSVTIPMNSVSISEMTTADLTEIMQ